MKIKLIICDFDGPINNLTQVKIETIRFLAQELNVDIRTRVTNELINYIDQIYETQKITSYQEIIKIALTKLLDRKLIDISKDQIEIFSNSFGNEMNKHIAIDIKLINLLQLKKEEDPNLRVCIYSSQTKENINLLLKRFQVTFSLFDEIYSRESFEEPKPSMVNLEKICLDFNLQPSEAIMIGDNVVIDLAPAKYLGIKTILVSKLVDYSIESSEELAKILE